MLSLGHFRLLIVGEGSEREWLRKHLRFAEFAGILKGDALADAFAAMDVFAFPSETDTFGLLLLAMASGVPVVVGPATGIRIEICHACTGFVANHSNDFTQSVSQLMGDASLRHEMGVSSRRLACSKGWDGVFDQLYQTYEAGLEQVGRGRCLVPLAESN